MFIIWSGWGWLVLPFFLAVWALADGPFEAVYAAVAGLDTSAEDYYGLGNPEKGVCWAAAFVVVSFPLAALSLWRKHRERRRTPEELQAEDATRRTQLAAWEKSRVDLGQQPDPNTQAILAGTAPLPPVVRRRSSFFFVPFWIFPFVFELIGVLVLVLNLPAALEYRS